MAKRFTAHELARQWDAVAVARDVQIGQGADISYSRVLVPWIMRQIPRGKLRVLDAGCGTGRLAAKLASVGHKVIGVDVSEVSVRIAEARVSSAVFFCGTIESYLSNGMSRFDAVVANMVLQDSPRLVPLVRAIAGAVVESGVVVATITHPWFWPRYWGYENEEWFEYSREIAVCAPLRTSLMPAGLGKTTHFHRPVESYFRAFSKAGLVVDSVCEPMPTPSVMKLYPKKWEFPRFLAFRLRKPR